MKSNRVDWSRPINCHAQTISPIYLHHVHCVALHEGQEAAADDLGRVVADSDLDLHHRHPACLLLVRNGHRSRRTVQLPRGKSAGPERLSAPDPGWDRGAGAAEDPLAGAVRFKSMDFRALPLLSHQYALVGLPLRQLQTLDERRRQPDHDPDPSDGKRAGPGG